MGQAANVTNDTALDTVITNALIVDAVAGVIKADVGIKVCLSTSVTIYMTKYHNAPHKGLPQGGKRIGGDPNAI